MKVVVRYAPEAEFDLGRYLCSRRGSRADVELMLETYVEQVKSDLIRTNGVPPDAICLRQTEPRQYTLEERRRWLRPPVRTITINRFCVRE